MASAHSNPTTRTLLDHVEHKRTGRLSVGAGSAEIALFVLDGALVGTQANDDTAALISRLEASGKLGTARARQLQAMVQMSLPILGRHTHDPILGLLADELGDDVFSSSMADRFDENVRRYVSHPGQPRFVEGLAPWCENLQVTRDTVERVAACVRDVDLIAACDFSRSVSTGRLAPRNDLEELVVSRLADAPRSLLELTENLDLEPIAAKAAVARMADAGVIGETVSDDHDSAFDLPPTPARGEVSMVPDDELDAFAGVDDSRRGGNQDGTFVTAKRNLDRVEITDIDALDSSADDRGHDVAFSAPTLTEDVALGKIDVANEVLGTLSKAIDEARGPRRGHGTIQLLVDGRPRQYTALFDGLKVTPSGGLPSEELLSNLRRRPAPEQRRLLNQGVLDLLDRALDRAADELPDEVFDTVLEQVMGYRQRLGL